MSGPLPRPGARPPGAALDDAEIAAAVRLSFLRRVPAASLVRLLDDALDVVVPAGGGKSRPLPAHADQPVTSDSGGVYVAYALPTREP